MSPAHFLFARKAVSETVSVATFVLKDQQCGISYINIINTHCYTKVIYYLLIIQIFFS